MKGVKMLAKSTLLIVLMYLVRVKSLLDLPEGAPCTDGGVNGTCVSLYKCESIAWRSLYMRAGVEVVSGPLPEICSYSDIDEPIYCCTDCKLDGNEKLRNYFVSPGGELVEKKKSIAWNKCMEHFQDLPYKCRGEGLPSKFLGYSEEGQCFEVVDNTYPSGAGGLGGRDAELWELPHMALLGYGERQSAQWLCGGSVISERFILTAAHCSSHPVLGRMTLAGLGLLKRSDLDQYWNIYNLKRIISHPNYKSPSKYHDIALVETDRDINYGRGLLPACLDIGEETDQFDGNLDAAGWGKLANKQLAETLQVLELKTFEKTQCEAKFPPHRHLKNGYNHTTQLCCGAAKENVIIDTCEGDSGGPAHYENYCLYVIVGVTSFGRECGTVGGTGMYTRVKHYVPWIESIVWP